MKQVQKPKDIYIRKDKIGRGSYAAVWLGEHTKTKMPCAIKIITKREQKDSVYDKLSKNELTILQETIHPHITRVFELLEDTGSYWIVMEHVQGGSLFDIIRKGRRLTEN